jgi:antiphage defense system Thoeris ThsB-like protein
MARRTFFSFHYQPDVSRAWIVRNSWMTKPDRDDAGFFDSSVFECKQRESDDVLKRFLRDGLGNTSVTCVLVGAETTLRRWVRYELFQSFIRGNGILAARIHGLANLDRKLSAAGSNPLADIAFLVDGDRLRFKEYMTSGWQYARDVGSMPLSDVAYDLGSRTNHTFSSMFPIYDYVEQDGYKNIGTWIDDAAGVAGH